ncbi:MAG: hypothetical protein AB8G05_16315 [Oligoflexales bacterium]
MVKSLLESTLIVAKGYTRDHIDLNRCLNCPVADHKLLKFTLIELKDAKFSLYRLKDHFDLWELKAAKFHLVDLKKECRYNFRDYVKAGSTLQELADAGFTAIEFKRVKCSARTLKRLGFSARDLKYAGYTFCERRGCSFN